MSSSEMTEQLKKITKK